MRLVYYGCSILFFFFQAEDGIRDYKVTGVQTCALPISYLEGEDKDPQRTLILSFQIGPGQPPHETPREHQRDPHPEGDDLVRPGRRRMQEYPENCERRDGYGHVSPQKIRQRVVRPSLEPHRRHASDHNTQHRTSPYIRGKV